MQRLRRGCPSHKTLRVKSHDPQIFSCFYKIAEESGSMMRNELVQFMRANPV